MSIGAIRSIIGDELKPDTPLARMYAVAKQNGELRGKRGQSFVGHPETSRYAIGHGVHPTMQLVEILKGELASGKIQSGDPKTFIICRIGPDDLSEKVVKLLQDPSAIAMSQELRASGVSGDILIDPVTGLFQLGGRDAAEALVRRINPDPSLMGLDREIAARLEIGKGATQWTPEEVENTVRVGIVDLVNGRVVESREIPIPSYDEYGREIPKNFQ